MRIQTKQKYGIEFYQKGSAPVLLILSGMHGDESGVIPHVREFVESNYHTLPDFIYIPQVSPSAVLQSTRYNKYGHDINRYFTSSKSDPESRAVMKLLRTYSFTFSLDTHEDPEFVQDYYTYDTGILSKSELQSYRNAVTLTGTRLFTGLDDDADPTLGFMVQQGYVSLCDEIGHTETGFLSDWMKLHNVSKRAFTLEIPGKSSISTKRKIIQTLFPYFLKFST